MKLHHVHKVAHRVGFEQEDIHPRPLQLLLGLPVLKQMGVLFSERNDGVGELAELEAAVSGPVVLQIEQADVFR